MTCMLEPLQAAPGALVRKVRHGMPQAATSPEASPGKAAPPTEVQATVPPLDLEGATPRLP